MSQNDRRNAGMSAVAFLSRPALQLLVTPFLLKELGADGFGLWMIVQSLIALTGMADLGIAPATTLFVARYVGKDDRKGVLRILGVSWTLYGCINVLLFALVFWTSPFLLEWMNAGSLLNGSLDLSMRLLLALAVSSQLLQSLLDAILRGFERYDLESGLRLVGNILILVGIALMAWLRQGIEGMLLLQALVFCVSILASVGLVVRQVGSLRWIMPQGDLRTLREIFQVGVYGGLQGVFSVLFSQVDRLMVASLMGPAVTGYYAACMQLTQLAHGVLARALSFLFPKFAGIPEKNHDQRWRVFRKGMVISTFIGCVISLVLFFPARLILQRWLGDDLPADLVESFRWLAIVNAFYATTIVPHNLLLGRGAFHLGALFSFLSFAFVAGGSVVLIPAYGILGAALGKLLFLPSSILSRVVVLKQAFGVSSWWDGLSQLFPVAVCFCVALPLEHLLHIALPSYPIAVWFFAGGTATLMTVLALRLVYRIRLFP